MKPIKTVSRSHFKSSLKRMMTQARVQMASYIMASLSQRTTGLLKLSSRANVLSTRHLFLYSSAHLLRRPLRFLRGGMQGITPLRRSQLRKRSQSYALSATGRSGRFLHGTRTRSKVSWARFTSGRPGRWRESEESRSHPPPASASSPCPPRSIRSLLFFAGRKLPSRNARDHKSFPSSSGLERNIPPDAGPCPSSCHLFNLGHAVTCDLCFRGVPFHAQPVRSIHAGSRSVPSGHREPTTTLCRKSGFPWRERRALVSAHKTAR